MILALLLWAGVAQAKIAPPNTYNIPEMITINTISKTSFTTALDRFEAYYVPRLKAKGITLRVERLWSDGTVNSDTYENGNEWVINAYGGLARWPGMTTVGYATVICHELGHHMGGAPLYPRDWASDEGQSDYWASKECMKALGYTPTQIQSGAVNISKVLADLGNEPVPSKYIIDKTVVRATNHDHPKAQCRLDTYLNGYLCKVRGDMSKTNPKTNACWTYPSSTTYGKGDRPRCWFRP